MITFEYDPIIGLVYWDISKSYKTNKDCKKRNKSKWFRAYNQKQTPSRFKKIRHKKRAL